MNIGGDAATLTVEGRRHTRIYHAVLHDGGRETLSQAERVFCIRCGSALWLFDPRWPDLIHPYASAIDTELPVPPEHTHIMLGSKAGWVEVELHRGDTCADDYPDESLAEWHGRLGLEDGDADDAG